MAKSTRVISLVLRSRLINSPETSFQHDKSTRKQINEVKKEPGYSVSG